MKKVHMFKLGPNCQHMGQSFFEFTHTTKCGYVRDLVTKNESEVTCRMCLRELSKNPELLEASQ